MKKRRTLIFGIDGGTWDVLNPLMDRGVMPCLSQLKAEGAWGNLESVVPVNSAAAWSSFLTGIAPEKHGVYDFFAWQPGKTRRISANASWLPRPTLFDLLREEGPVLALKVPMTYPPWPIRGAMVSGLPTPDDESAFTHPPELARRLNPVIEKGSSGRSWELSASKRHPILNQLFAAQRSLERMTDLLLEECNPNVCFVVARDVDELQHFFWDVLNGQDDFGYLPRIEDYFADLDRYLARMMDWAGQDARIMILSDHGFGPVEGVWHLNEWLRSRGFLSLMPEFEKPSVDKNLPWDLRLNFALRRRLLKGLKRLGVSSLRGLESSLEKLKLRSQRDTNLTGIDWSSTLAYAGNVGEEWLPVYINLAGREPQGAVSPKQYEQIREDLRSTLIKNSDPTVLEVHRSEEIFDIPGGCYSAAPDLIVETLSGAVQSDFALGTPFVYEQPRNRNGCHQRRGMVLLWGVDVAKAEINASLLDVPATILAWIGMPVPRHFDGKPLLDYITGVIPVESEFAFQVSNSEKLHLSEDEEAGVRKKLESLGYL